MDASNFLRFQENMKNYQITVLPADANQVAKMLAAADLAFKESEAIFRIGANALPHLSIFSFKASSLESAENSVNRSMIRGFNTKILWSTFYIIPVEFDGKPYVDFGLQVDERGGYGIDDWISLAYEMPGRLFNIRWEDVRWNPDRYRMRIAVLPAGELPQAVHAFTPFLKVNTTEIKAEPERPRLPLIKLPKPAEQKHVPGLSEKDFPPSPDIPR